MTAATTGQEHAGHDHLLGHCCGGHAGSPLLDALVHALVITGFVFVMMLIIEFINVLIRGVWHESLGRSRWRQYLFGACLGVIPGCLGSFMVVALFSHGVVGFGALVAAMIATSGDEAFVMLAALPPATVALIMGVLLGLGFAAGKLVDHFFSFGRGTKQLALHDHDEAGLFPPGGLLPQLRALTLQRGGLLLALALLMGGFISGRLGPPEWDWKRVTFLLLSSLCFVMVLTVSEHFLEEHLWNHVVKKHLPRLFLWTLGALLVLGFLLGELELKQWIHENGFLVLLIACLTGLVPESGPHLVFVLGFVEGYIPLPILLASSIVQDGHGMLPLLAESPRSFVYAKLINLVLGLAVGGGVLLFW